MSQGSSHPSSCTDSNCRLSYRDHLLGIAIGSDALPSRRPEVSRINATERRWHKDMDTYASLRRDGLQPMQIDGCDRIAATATSKAQIEGTAA